MRKPGRDRALEWTGYRYAAKGSVINGTPGLQAPFAMTPRG